MAPSVRITYSRKRRLPPDFDNDGSGVVSSSPLLPQESVCESDGNRSSCSPCSSPTVKSRKPLGERSANSTVIRRNLSISAKPVGALSRSVKVKKPRLTQLTIDLGANPHRKCKVCGMEYIHTNKEDAALHKQFHSSCLTGLDIPKGTLGKMRTVWNGQVRGRMKKTELQCMRTKENIATDLGSVFEVDRRDGLAVKNFAKKVLRVAEKELGAVEIEERNLWDFVPAQWRERPEEQNLHSKTQMAVGRIGTSSNNLEDTGQSDAKYDRYKIYLFVLEGKCTGLCLAERIRRARSVLPSISVDRAFQSSSIAAQPDDFVLATLGISRIWVSGEHRGIGVATALVHAARKHFLHGAVVAKDDIAWSQPTESGARFARGYFGRDDGWLVYDEQFWDD